MFSARSKPKQEISKRGREMKLYLVQHGNCVSKEINPDRPLSDKGRGDVERAAGFIKPLNITAKVWHSGKTRAKETAEILSSVMRVDGEVTGIEGLGPNGDVVDVKGRVESLDGDVMLVGHLPFMNKLTSLLLLGDENKEVVKFVQGGIVCLSDENGWGVEWMEVPEIV